jgi:hypothetical protein
MRLGSESKRRGCCGSKGCDCQFGGQEALEEAERRISQVYRVEISRVKRALANTNQQSTEIIDKYNQRNHELLCMMVRIMQDYEEAMAYYMDAPVDPAPDPPSGECQCLCRYTGCHHSP